MVKEFSHPSVASQDPQEDMNLDWGMVVLVDLKKGCTRASIHESVECLNLQYQLGGPEQEMGVVPVVELHKVEVLTKVA